MSFTGKTVLITGAGAGIGRAAAETFAHQDARVAVVDLSQERAEETVNVIRQAGGTASAFAADVSQRTQIESAVAAVRQMYGPITILVNNAGIAHRNTPLVDVDPATLPSAPRVISTGRPATSSAR